MSKVVLKSIQIQNKDTSDTAVEDFFGYQAGRSAAGIRAGAVNPNAPAWMGSSLLKNGSCFGSLTNSDLILPHDFLNRNHFST